MALFPDYQSLANFGKKAPKIQYTSARDYGSPLVQKYNINSGAPVGVAPQQVQQAVAPVAPRQYASQSAGRLANAVDYSTPIAAPQQAAIQSASRRAHVGSGNKQQATQSNADPMAAFLDMNQGYGTYAQPVSTGKLNYDQVASDPNAMNIDQVAFNPQSMNYGYAGDNNTDGLSNFLDRNNAYGTDGSWGSSVSNAWDSTSNFFKNNKDMFSSLAGFGTNIMGIVNGRKANQIAEMSLEEGRRRYDADYAAQKNVVNGEKQRQLASDAGAGGMTRAEANAYAAQRIKEVGIA